MRSSVTLVLAVLILVGSLLPNMATHELAKLPTMLEHFREHKAAASEPFSFFQFLALHYALGSDHHEPNHETDLPLMDQHICGVNLFISDVEHFDFLPDHVTESPYGFWFDHYFYSHTSRFAQPPRQA
jgi:hypothetical protein